MWIGGSILGSLSSFQSHWASKDQYDEIGPNSRDSLPLLPCCALPLPSFFLLPLLSSHVLSYDPRASPLPSAANLIAYLSSLSQIHPRHLMRSVFRSCPWRAVMSRVIYALLLTAQMNAALLEKHWHGLMAVSGEIQSMVEDTTNRHAIRAHRVIL